LALTRLIVMPAEAGIQSGGHSAYPPGPPLSRVFAGGDGRKAAGVVGLVGATSSGHGTVQVRGVAAYFLFPFSLREIP